METAPGTESSLCVLRVGEAVFGIDTVLVREVLDQVRPQSVPLAPPFIAGAVAYRGEVLATVGMRLLLGLEREARAGYVVVLDDAEQGARFGLLVDEVGGVLPVQTDAREPNPQGLDQRSAALFDGVYRLERELLIRLDPERLQPARLAASGLFGEQMQAPQWGDRR